MAENKEERRMEETFVKESKIALDLLMKIKNYAVAYRVHRSETIATAIIV